MRTSPSGWSSDDPLVCDTNILLYGLPGGTTRRLLFELDRELHYPKASLTERQLLGKSRVSALTTHNLSILHGWERQNVASFLADALGIDWRWGVSSFESRLIDYDVARSGLSPPKA